MGDRAARRFLMRLQDSKRVFTASAMRARTGMAAIFIFARRFSISASTLSE